MRNKSHILQNFNRETISYLPLEPIQPFLSVMNFTFSISLCQGQSVFVEVAIGHFTAKLSICFHKCSFLIPEHKSEGGAALAPFIPKSEFFAKTQSLQRLPRSFSKPFFSDATSSGFFLLFKSLPWWTFQILGSWPVQSKGLGSKGTFRHLLGNRKDLHKLHGIAVDRTRVFILTRVGLKCYFLCREAPPRTKPLTPVESW